MVHNRTMGFPCNFDWWRQQQTAFFQMNFSREFNTLFMASSLRAKFRTLSQLLWLFSMYQSAFLCKYISSNVNIYFMLSNQQTGSTDQLEHLESFCCASKAQDSSLVYNYCLSFVLSYQPIRSNILCLI